MNDSLQICCKKTYIEISTYVAGGHNGTGRQDPMVARGQNGIGRKDTIVTGVHNGRAGEDIMVKG